MRVADDAGFDRFRLVGYSGVAPVRPRSRPRHRERLLSLALMKAAWAGNASQTADEQSVGQEFDRIQHLSGNELMRDFVRIQLRPGGEPLPPPPGPPPPWMASRPAGLKAMMHAFRTDELDLDALRSFYQPVYFALGGLSNPDYYQRMADRLATVFPDFTVEIYTDRHHFDPPHRAEPARVAAALQALWARAEAPTSPSTNA